jgi:murein L,D-transpeptidase YcbB/YkuD
MRGLLVLATLAFVIVLAPSSARAATGAQLWGAAGCGGCHTLAAAGSSGQVGPDLDSLRPSASRIAQQITSGGPAMPSFARLGYFHHVITGYYGPVTTAAVKAFQRSAGLKPDGISGPRTQASLRRRLG